jgi:murein DD-endopeptidase MepM/ murein hydrolase activator NlpD/transcriptional regulator with XRE-family HTH domain
MPSIRVLRRSRGMTLVELALRSGIPARTLGAIEYGLQELDANSRSRLADVFSVQLELVVAERPARCTPSVTPRHVTLLIFALTSALFLTPLLLYHQPSSEAFSWGGAAQSTVAVNPVREGVLAEPRRLAARATVRVAALRPAMSSRASILPSLTVPPPPTRTPTAEPTVPPTTAEPSLPDPRSAPSPVRDAAELNAAALTWEPTRTMPGVEPTPGSSAPEPLPAELPAAQPPIAPSSEAPALESTPEAPAPRPTPEAPAAEPTPEAPTLEATPEAPTATQIPDLPEPAPAGSLEADAPRLCPLIVNRGRIVVTQGYGEGTHAPAESAGALDLAVDDDGDGVDNPGATEGLPVVATHDGIAHVFPNSWPGGNFILLENAPAGWSTAYAHLSSIAVADGQSVRAGTLLGSVGNTGWATGPHLHYEVRRAHIHLDPSNFMQCDH